MLPGFGSCRILLTGISHEECVRYSSALRNDALCKGCPSPARQCSPCFKQGVSPEKHGRVDPKTGRCDFHKKNGDMAIRPEIAVPVIESLKMNTALDPLSPVLSEPSGIPKPRRKWEGPELPDGSTVPRIYAPIDSGFAVLIPAALIVDGVERYGNLAAREKKVMELVAIGKTRLHDIAEEMDISVNYASVMLTKLSSVFKVPKQYLDRKTQLSFRNTVFSLVFQEANRGQ